MSEARKVVKRVKNAVQFSDGTIRVDGVRASYPHLAEPFSSDDGKGKFGIVAMLPKETHREAAKLVSDFIKDLLAEKKERVSTDKRFFRDGNDTDKEEYQDHWVISANESRRPSVRHRSGAKMEKDEIEESIYGGCWVNVLIRPWFQDGQRVGKGYGKRVNAGLVGVQYVKEGEAFGDGRIDDEDAWDSVEDEGGFDDDMDGGSSKRSSDDFDDDDDI